VKESEYPQAESSDRIAEGDEMKSKLPSPVQKLRKSYPAIWKKFENLGTACHEAGPLDEHTRRILKVAIAAAAQSEGAVHSAVRHARIAGVQAQEIRHAILLTITTIGFPRAMAALSWAEDILRRRVG
jgi:alkylhydroperoxidase/carboxymuconolactone decarboxylase family protein YurZ